MKNVRKMITNKVEMIASPSFRGWFNLVTKHDVITFWTDDLMSLVMVLVDYAYLVGNGNKTDIPRRLIETALEDILGLKNEANNPNNQQYTVNKYCAACYAKRNIKDGFQTVHYPLLIEADNLENASRIGWLHVTGKFPPSRGWTDHSSPVIDIDDTIPLREP